MAWYDEPEAQIEDLKTAPASVAQPWYEAEDAKIEEPMSWTDVASNAARNFVPSAQKLGKDLIDAVMSPLDTADAVTKLGAGVLQMALPDKFVDMIGRDQESIDMARAVGQLYVQRYGGGENIKQTIAKDPAGFLADVAPIITAAGKIVQVGGQAANAGKVAKAGEVVKNIGKYSDPFNVAMSGTKGALNAVGTVGGDLIQSFSGITPDAITEAFLAGKTGGSRSTAFKAGMNTDVSRKIVDQSKAALKAMKEQADQQYGKSMQVIKSDRTQLPLDKIDASLQRIQSMTVTPAGRVRSDELSSLYKKLKAKVDAFKAAGDYSPAEIDLLKQDIADLIYDPSGKPALANRTANAMATDLFSATKNTLTEYNPSYAKIMGDYSAVMRDITEIKTGLSLGDRANVETAARKLLSTMRNNVNTNFGARQTYLEKLGEYGAGDVPAMVAGSEMSGSRGIQGAVKPLTTMTAGSLDPMAGAAVLAGSTPRLIGNASHTAGRVAGMLDPMGMSSGTLQFLQENPHLLNIIYQQERAQRELEEQNRGMR